MTTEELSIGEFARRTRLPVSTLRFYHEAGVLVPTRVDLATGYRYYAADQVDAGVEIATMRELGVPLDELAALNKQMSMLQILERHGDRLRVEVSERTRAIERIEALVGAPADRGCVGIVDRVPRRVPAVSGSVEIAGAAGTLRRFAAVLRSQLRSAGVGDPAWYGALLPLDLYDEAVPTAVFADVAVPKHVVMASIDLPGGEYATCTHTGDTAMLPATYRIVVDWIDQHGRAPAGHVIEEYRLDGSTLLAVQLEEVAS